MSTPQRPSQRSEPKGLAVDSLRPPGAIAASPPPRIRSSDLLRGGDRLLIEHGGEAYQLRLTRLGKLILTK